MKVLAVVLAVLAVVASAACGGGEDGGGAAQELTLEESATVAGFNADVAFTVLDSSGYGDLLTSIDEVTVIARAKPDALYETEADEELGYEATSRTMRQVLADAASSLDGYQPELVAELERTLDTLPPPE